MSALVVLAVCIVVTPTLSAGYTGEYALSSLTKWVVSSFLPLHWSCSLLAILYLTRWAIYQLINSGE